MNKHFKHLGNISRRETLKALIVPAGAALTGKWLLACSAADSGSSIADEAEAADNGSLAGSIAAQSPAAGSSATGVARAPTPAANGGASGSRAGSGNAHAGAASSPMNTAGNAAANSVGGAQATAGSNSSAAGSPATAVTGGAGTAAGGAGGTAAQAGAGGSASSVAGPGVMWATGGTAKMATSYPDPFELGAGTTCKLYPSQTLGPCYAEQPMMRTDISDGLDGLPTRVSFLVVGADGCTPIPNATVDIWHSGSQGIYSAYAMGTTCNPGSENVLSDMFCRGVQAVDETGRVNFSTVFPGWYRGRTLHIHFTVRVGGRDTVTSQLYFDDKLVDEILAQGYYQPRGMRDTTNQRDGIFSSGGATAEQVVMEHVKRPDGVLHLWKVLSLG